MMLRFAHSLWLVAMLGSAISTTPVVAREGCELYTPIINGQSFVVDGRDVQAVARAWLPAAIQLDDAVAELSPREEAWLAGEMKQRERVLKAMASVEHVRQNAKRDTKAFRLLLQALADGKQDQISAVRRVLFLLDQLVESDASGRLTRLILDGELPRKVVFWEMFQDLNIMPQPDALAANIRFGRDIFARDLIRCTLPALIGTEFFTR